MEAIFDCLQGLFISLFLFIYISPSRTDLPVQDQAPSPVTFRPNGTELDCAQPHIRDFSLVAIVDKKLVSFRAYATRKIIVLPVQILHSESPPIRSISSFAEFGQTANLFKKEINPFYFIL